jgi:hypothetical protein
LIDDAVEEGAVPLVVSANYGRADHLPCPLSPVVEV